MKTGSSLFGFASVALLVTACKATVGTGAGISVPADAPVTCGGYCSKMGMTLGAVVVMASNVGCVCSPVPQAAPGAQTPATPQASAPAAGGMAAILIQEEAARRQQQSVH